MAALSPETEALFLVTLIVLVAHLVAEAREHRRAVVATKLLASTGFLLTAHSAGALAVDWGRWLFLGLALSWIGDACLLSRERRMFLAGLVAFLLGHVSYCAAFWVHGVDRTSVLVALPVVAAIGLAVDRWLAPHLREGANAGMRAPVRAYIVVISTMLALAYAAWRADAPPILAIGALSFYLSDLAVARDRFVRTEFLNRAWGLPAYYLGQLCLAVAVVAAG